MKIERTPLGRPAWLALVLSAPLALTACGGGGGDGGSASDSPIQPVAAVESPVGEFVVNPKASWKRATPDDPDRRQGIASVELSRLSASSLVGRTLNVKSLGSFAYGDTAGQTTPDASLLFVDASGQALSPAAGSTAPAATKPIACENIDGIDPVAGDVLVSAAGANLVVPAGATAVWLSVDDCHYADNSQTGNPLRVKFVVR